MINIVEHLWQYQIPWLGIVPTVIKIQQETPKTYYYSEKSHRVLRKKNQNLETAMQTLEILNANQQFLFFKLLKGKGKGIIEISLGLSSQIGDLLNDDKVCCCIVGIQGRHKIQKIVKIKLDISLNFSSQLVMSKEKHPFMWTTSTLTPLSDDKLLKAYAIRCWQQLSKSLKTKSKCKLLQLVIGMSTQNIYIIWCNQLIYQQSQFYQMQYQMITQDQQQQKGKQKDIRQRTSIQRSIHKISGQIKVQDRRMKQMDQNEREIKRVQSKSDPKGILNQQKQGIRCKACQLITDGPTKQVQSEQVINLRRNNKLSIKGLLQAYYTICQPCYNLTDQ